MAAYFPAFLTMLLALGCSFSVVHGAEPPTIEELLARVPEGAAWQDLAPDLQAGFEQRAAILLDEDRRVWGLAGLRDKEAALLSAPTSAMAENIDRVLSFTYASELPGGFRMARDVSNADLKRQLIRIYLSITDSRGYLLYNHKDWMGWDGKPLKELQLLDHEHMRIMAVWLQQTEDDLRKIPVGELTPVERALREKSFFTTRAGKHFEKPAVGNSGSMTYSGLYDRAEDLRPFLNDMALLEAYNASMFSEFRDVDMGTLDAFMFDYYGEFERASLIKQRMSGTLADKVLKLGHLYLTRVQALPGKTKRCTIYSPAEIAANWDTFTAQQISNADGKETMQSYAKAFEPIIAQRLAGIQAVARDALVRLFPDGSPELTIDQRDEVADRLLHETRPAMMLETLISALDEVTGNTIASAKVKDAIDKQPTVGGGYAPGENVREEDRAQILDMWNKLRDFIKREYSGYRIDIAALLPKEPIIRTVDQSQYTLGGDVYLSLGVAWNLPSFSSTFMHEMKHAIDQRSNAPVEGAAWEGAATSVERQVWPLFIEEAMKDQGPILAVARMKTEVDNVRFTATTDATLQKFLRQSCEESEPDTIAFAENIVRGYGYTQPEILRLRSRRAHRGTQYLEYDYGLAQYRDLLSYLQAGVGASPRVDAFLLQACGLPSPKMNQATIDDLKVCIRDRKS